MANRHTLHINKLNNLKNWLEKQGYILLPTSKNPYEVLKAKKDNDTVIIYCKADSKEHLSVMDKDYSLIRRFVNESKAQTNADRIRGMTDDELARVLKKAFNCGGLIAMNQSSAECRGCKDGYCCNIDDWLKAESEE